MRSKLDSMSSYERWKLRANGITNFLLYQVMFLLYVAHIMIHTMWRYKIDPDNSAIPYLTALGDLSGSLFLAVAFWFIYAIDKKYCAGEQIPWCKAGRVDFKAKWSHIYTRKAFSFTNKNKQMHRRRYNWNPLYHGICLKWLGKRDKKRYGQMTRLVFSKKENAEPARYWTRGWEVKRGKYSR